MLKFDINLLFALINLIIFFVLIRFVLFKPIKKALDKRRELIDKQFDEADKVNHEALKLKDAYQSQLENVEDTKKQMIAEAQSTAKNEYDKILQRAQTDADKVKADAKKAVELENEKARLAVKEEIAKLAMETAEKVVGSAASPETDSSLYDKFLNESSEN